LVKRGAISQDAWLIYARRIPRTLTDYELHLCENCFFVQVSTIKRTRWISVMFEDEGDAILKDDAYGRVTGRLGIWSKPG